MKDTGSRRKERLGLRNSATYMRLHLLSFQRRFEFFSTTAYRWIGILVFITAVACITCLILYGGFDGRDIDRHKLRHILSVCQSVFILNILFCSIFRFRDTWIRSHWVRRLADISVLFTVIPALWPHTSGELGSFIHFFHSRYYLYSILGLYSIAETCYAIMNVIGKRTNPSLLLSASFLFFIFIGSFVLMMPRCTVGHVSYIDSLFMAASAVSMTGLTTVNLATHYTPLGWFVIAILLQIGALGVLTFTSFFAVFFSGRQSIYNQLLIRDFIYSKSMSALLPVMFYILAFTVTVEAIGAVCIYFTLPDDFLGDTHKRIFFAIFHSMSGFCNGGFTTLHDGLETPALLNGNEWFYIVMTVLILAGGLGFPNLVNFKDASVEYLLRLKARITGTHRETRRIHIYDLNTKLVLVATAALFVGGTVLFFIFEYNGVLGGLPIHEKIVQAIFNSATPRTAGFCSMNITSFSNVSFLVMLFLMWVGCSSQSMGGGIKVNTFMAVLFNLRSVVRGDRGVVAFHRNIALPSVRRANAVVCLSILAVFLYSGIIMALQPELGFKEVLFECFSAITTVGLSFGITPELSDISKMVIASAMFLGRVGIISVLSGLISHGHNDISDFLPNDNIIIN